jgi:hypothetical protein
MVYGLGFGVQDIGFGVCGSWCMVISQGVGFREWVFEIRV